MSGGWGGVGEKRCGAASLAVRGKVTPLETIACYGNAPRSIGFVCSPLEHARMLWDTARGCGKVL